MKYESLKDELKPYYQKGDCCTWIVELRKEKAELQQRIEKAIEYIKPYRDGNITWYEFTIQDKIELLEILGDKE